MRFASAACSRRAVSTHLVQFLEQRFDVSATTSTTTRYICPSVHDRTFRDRNVSRADARASASLKYFSTAVSSTLFAHTTMRAAAHDNRLTCSVRMGEC